VKRSYTLIEVVVAVIIVGVIASIVGVNVQGCTNGVQTGASTKHEMEQTEVNHETLVAAVPPPRLNTSQERINLKKRLERFNSESKVSYIYLIDYGKIMAFYSVKGKVSSVNSLLTTPDQIVSMRNAGLTAENKVTRHVVASPDLDGSYGSNGDAIFFFTTDDTYVEWSGRYMLCDKPLKLSTPPVVVINESPEVGD
jgi:prepilin-type N-terminal cleavage/methylation domain-containing protein